MQLKEEINKFLNNIQIDFGGGCSCKKAVLIGYLIKKFKLTTTLDIGVYRGRSFFPQAITHKNLKNGVVYGVDPYSNEEARQIDNFKLKNDLDTFVNNTNFENIYKDVKTLIEKNNLDDYANIIRETSKDAANYFSMNKIQFDLIHIDGNHDTRSVLMDVSLYLPKLKMNGFVVLDDISWDSVRPAYNILNKKLVQLITVQSIDDDFTIFMNSKNSLNLIWGKVVLRTILFGL
jgi:hypothetical protein